MKAPVFKGVGKPLSIETIPDPTPGAGELVLKVGRCGICGTDLHMTDGHAHTFPENTIIGHEFAGEVVAKGANTDRYRIGDIVAAMPVVGCGHCGNCLNGEPMWCVQGLIGISGGFGQYAIARAHAAIRLPQSLSLTDGALVEPLAVGLHGVRLARLDPGARVLVQGAGSIGLAAAFWARRLGAGRIAVTSRSSRGEVHAMEMGATTFILGGDGLQQRVDAALGGPPDAIFECVGVPGMIAQAINLVRPRGTVIILGNCMLPDTFYPAQALFKEIRLQGSMVYSLPEFQAVADTLDRGAIEPRTLVTDIFSYLTLPEGFEALRRPVEQCKAMVDPWA